ncbi:copper amine oxidase N-terminal domain-containing protein [Paenibacillus sp. BC26]|uniref:copper amine oxidase N-terminal domain-containing protein n=1 Tax=Paenibacillus sp. BC26 TaxID=1881032 RepID=UPI0008E12C5F|nr:copper amine oxidase N-terminal domain-containing protein [Paenibacillus sp. BC26]SFT27077.1 Copper amine oxidase N-terminal domain-containing protein [Paenibacillus sp. BC26]
MKKLLCWFLLLCTLTTGFPRISDAAAEQLIAVTINGDKQFYDQHPLQFNGAVVVPLRAIFTSLGATLQYDTKTQTITAATDVINVVLQVGSKTAKVNNKPAKLSQAAVIIKGSTYVPVRFIAEAFGADVKWDAARNTVVIHYVNSDRLQTAISKGDLKQFTALLKLASPDTATSALKLLIANKKDAQWAKVALDAGGSVVKPYNYFAEAIILRQMDEIRTMLETGMVNPTTAPRTAQKISYIGLAQTHYTTPIMDPSSMTIIPVKNSEPSMELAQLLYDFGFKADNIDAVLALSNSKNDWLDWILSHGADPNGETMKLVKLEGPNDNSIHFYHPLSTPFPYVKQKLIDVAYAVSSWGPSLENMRNLDLLIVKYGADLSPLTQAQKDRLLELASSNNMSPLAEALVKAGAMKQVY